MGEIQYEIWKLSLSNLSFDDKSINCEPGLSGLKISMYVINDYYNIIHLLIVYYRRMSTALKNIHWKYSALHIKVFDYYIFIITFLL